MYFYCHEKLELYRYTLEGKDLVPCTTLIKIPEDFGRLDNVVNPRGNLMAITKEGYILRVTSPCVFTPKAVNEAWVKSNDPRDWWLKLDKISNAFSVPTIAMFGVKDERGLGVPMWYHQGGCVIGPQELHGRSVQLIGFHSQNTAAWLRVWESPGVSKGWQQDYAGKIVGALSNLTKRGSRHAEVLFLLDKARDAAATSWFSPFNSQIFKFTPEVSSPSSLLPSWLGGNIEGTFNYVHCRKNGNLYALIQGTTTKKIGNFPIFRRKGDALTLSVDGPSTFKVLPMRNVRNIGMAADAGATLMLSDGAWKVYVAFSMSTFANSAKLLTINLPPIAHPSHVVVIDGKDKDLIVVDSVAGTSLTLTSAQEGEGAAVVLQGTQGYSAALIVMPRQTPAPRRGVKRQSSDHEPAPEVEGRKGRKNAKTSISTESESSTVEQRQRLTTTDLEFDYDQSQLRDPRPTPGRVRRPRLQGREVTDELKRQFFIPKLERPKGRFNRFRMEKFDQEQVLLDPAHAFHDSYVCYTNGPRGPPTYDSAGFQLDFEKVADSRDPKSYRDFMRGLGEAHEERDLFETFFDPLDQPGTNHRNTVKPYVKDHISKDLGVPWHQINAQYTREWLQRGFRKRSFLNGGGSRMTKSLGSYARQEVTDKLVQQLSKSVPINSITYDRDSIGRTFYHIPSMSSASGIAMGSSSKGVDGVVEVISDILRGNASSGDRAKVAQGLSTMPHPPGIGDWPRRLLHVPSMTSMLWQPGNYYSRFHEPKYNAMSYTWGRFRLDKDSPAPHAARLRVDDIEWDIPPIDPLHFSVDEFRAIINRVAQSAYMTPVEFIWVDIACIDQRRGSEEGNTEIGRQAAIFRGAQQVFIWLTSNCAEEARRAYKVIKQLPVLINSLEPDNLSSPDWQDKQEEAEAILQNWRRSFHIYLSDPWFSSLWALQEATLCPFAQILSLDAGKSLTASDLPGKDSTNEFEEFLAFVNGIYMDLCELLLDNDSSILSGHGKAISICSEVKQLIEKRGLPELFWGNRIAIYCAAGNRTATESCDYVYAIQQVFGYRLGNTTGSGDSKNRIWSLPELEVQLGRQLVHDYPMQSQMHAFTKVVSRGQGWHINSHSRFAAPNTVSPWHGLWDEEPEPSCEITSQQIKGVWYGRFSGYMCEYGTMHPCWEEINQGVVSFQHIVLDAIPKEAAMKSGEPLQYRTVGHVRDPKGPGEANTMAAWLASFYESQPLYILRLGSRKVAENEYFEREIVALLLLEIEPLSELKYWKRIGFCSWSCMGTQSRATTGILAANDNSDVWHKAEGFFG
ncbi:hypothetical protein FHL15_010307 [Xylaria flabelliformis]|uniref:Heterokaryon incompatibility domain-containing protein n=1 Tax=Xylaria flabelliformis TaxID=2512241 RepID=A0A553HLL6_9PEZI|nr:hypothetical protein FHL15_010307 [Xylaria flabelliformis]